MIIRKISNEDLKSCAEILKTAYEKEPYCENFQQGNELKYIEEKYQNCSENSFVVSDGSEVFGFVFWSISCWTDGPQAILEEIVIASDQQNKGVGKQLVEHSHEYLKNKGVKSVMLWAINDPRVVGFHKKNGYSKSDEHCVMFGNL